MRTSQAKGGIRTCTTYAVLESGPDVQPEGKGKTVLAWEEHLAGGMSTSTESEKKKRVATVREAFVTSEAACNLAFSVGTSCRRAYLRAGLYVLTHCACERDRRSVRCG